MSGVGLVVVGSLVGAARAFAASEPELVTGLVVLEASGEWPDGPDGPDGPVSFLASLPPE